MTKQDLLKEKEIELYKIQKQIDLLFKKLKFELKKIY